MVQPSGAIGADAVSTSWPWMFWRPATARAGARAAGLRGLHLGQLRHVGVAQHQADVGMRDQAALRADDIGMTALADLDLRHHVPDQLQIDLGDADAGVLAGAGQRQRHIGLGFAAEIDRPVIDLVGHGLGEFRILGEVEPGIPPRPWRAAIPASRSLPVESTCASSVIAGTCRNSRKRIEPALLDRARRPRQLGGPAELAFDLLDELADLGGRGLGLLVLDPDQRGLVLAIIEENLENAVGQQRDADHRDEQRDVFGEQPAADFGPGRACPAPRPPRAMPRASGPPACRDGGKCSSRAS